MFPVLLRHNAVHFLFGKRRKTPLKIPCKFKQLPQFQGTRNRDCPRGAVCLRQTPILPEDSILRRQLLHEVNCPAIHTGLKVSIIGCGFTGMTSTFSLFQQGVVSRLALVDENKQILQGEQMDMTHASIFLDNRQIVANTDLSVTAGSHLCVITPGTARKAQEDPEEHLVSNLETVARVVPELLRYSPNTLLLVVTNPVELVTYAAWRISGLAPERVIGTGTFLDSARFQFYLAERLGVPMNHIQNAWVVGMQGKRGIPAWSCVDVNGIRLRDTEPKIGTPYDKANWSHVYTCAAYNAERVFQLKGYSSWALGLSVTELVRSLLLTCNLIFPVCMLATGFHGIREEVYLSLPCMLCSQGVSSVVRLNLDEFELRKLRETSSSLAKKIYELGL